LGSLFSLLCFGICCGGRQACQVLNRLTQGFRIWASHLCFQLVERNSEVLRYMLRRDVETVVLETFSVVGIPCVRRICRLIGTSDVRTAFSGICTAEIAGIRTTAQCGVRGNAHSSLPANLSERTADKER